MNKYQKCIHKNYYLNDIIIRYDNISLLNKIQNILPKIFENKIRDDLIVFCQYLIKKNIQEYILSSKELFIPQNRSRKLTNVQRNTDAEMLKKSTERAQEYQNISQINKRSLNRTPPLPPKKPPQTKIKNPLSGKQQILPNKINFDVVIPKHTEEFSHFLNASNQYIYLSQSISQHYNILNPTYGKIVTKASIFPLKEQNIYPSVSNKQSNVNKICVYQNLSKHRSELAPEKPKQRRKQPTQKLSPKNNIRAKSFENLLLEYKCSIQKISKRDINDKIENQCPLLNVESNDID